MKSTQCKMARAALDWSLDDLSNQSKVSRATIHRFEGGGDAYASTVEKLKTTFEAQGVEFTNGNAPGVRLHQK